MLVPEEKLEMVNIVLEREISASHTKTLRLFHPPVRYPDLSNEDLSQQALQGFAWHPNGVSFDLKSLGTWLIIRKAEKLQQDESDAKVSILLPFRVPEEGRINLAGDFDEGSIELSPGHYKLLFQLDFLSTSEEPPDQKYKEAFPEWFGKKTSLNIDVCKLTFVLTDEKIEPKLLNFQPIIPRKERLKVRRGLMAVEDFMPKTLIMSDELLSD